MTLSPNYGQQIKSQRKAFKMTQQQFAKKIGVGVATLQRYESNESQPTMATLERMAAALGMSPGEFFWKSESETNLTSLVPPDQQGAYTAADIIQRAGLTPVDGDACKYQIDQDYESLNGSGKQEAAKRVHELTFVPEYTEPEDK